MSSNTENSLQTPSTSKDEDNALTREKGGPLVLIKRIRRRISTIQGSMERSEGDTLSWKASFFRIFPLAGIFCVLVAVASIVASLGVLVGSRGQAVSTWAVPPSTYLALFTAITNQALRFAAFQGLAIAWWSKATRGTTIAQLHRSWRAGMTAGGAIRSGRNMGLIGIACLCSTFVAMDGPLLQKVRILRSRMQLIAHPSIRV